jgi:hypothetical protein
MKEWEMTWRSSLTTMRLIAIPNRSAYINLSTSVSRVNAGRSDCRDRMITNWTAFSHIIIILFTRQHGSCNLEYQSLRMVFESFNSAFDLATQATISFIWHSYWLRCHLPSHNDYYVEGNRYPDFFIDLFSDLSRQAKDLSPYRLLPVILCTYTRWGWS